LAARGISLDQTAISRIENQTRYVMDYEAAAIARCLKVSVGWLFGRAIEPPTGKKRWALSHSKSANGFWHGWHTSLVAHVVAGSNASQPPPPTCPRNSRGQTSCP
jgi:hypothetical protein